MTAVAVDAVLEFDHEECFELPGDRRALLFAVDRSGERWATAGALAAWLDYTPKGVRGLAEKADAPARTMRFALRNRQARAVRPVAVFSEDACLELLTRASGERVREVIRLFLCWARNQARLESAAARGPVPFARAVLGIAHDWLAPVARALPAGDERDLLADLCKSLAEGRRFAALHAPEERAPVTAQVRAAFALTRGVIDPDAARSQRAKDHHHQNRMTRGGT
jgi:hypothetical protein